VEATKQKEEYSAVGYDFFLLGFFQGCAEVTSVVQPELK
jgi:hypothetical protein